MRVDNLIQHGGRRTRHEPPSRRGNGSPSPVNFRIVARPTRLDLDKSNDIRTVKGRSRILTRGRYESSVM